MGFGQILRQWEEERIGQKKKLTRSGPGKISKDSLEQERWLEMYPPENETVESKSVQDIPPVSSGRSVWLRRPHQDTLDLHGLNGNEAKMALDRFIESMRRRNLRKALVIHGKGLHSQDRSILKPLVRKYLEESTEVGEFGTASRNDGGSGATWFLLRQRSR